MMNRLRNYNSVNHHFANARLLLVQKTIMIQISLFFYYQIETFSLKWIKTFDNIAFMICELTWPTEFWEKKIVFIEKKEILLYGTDDKRRGTLNTSYRLGWMFEIKITKSGWRSGREIGKLPGLEKLTRKNKKWPGILLLNR